MSILTIKSRLIILLSFSFIYGCSHSQSIQIEDYIQRDGDKIKVNIPYKLIPNLTYDTETEPFVVCLREKYAQSLFEAGLHLEHTLIRELYANFENIPVDSLQRYSDTELNDMVTSLFKPLFPEGKTIPNQEPSVIEKEPFNHHLLKENLQIEFIQTIAQNHASAEVVQDGKYVWLLKKENGKWKLYDGKKKN